MPAADSQRAAPGGDPDESVPSRPAAMCFGPAHVVVHGNPAIIAAYGRGAVGLPVREALLDLPGTAFAMLDAVLARGRPLARWVRRGGEEWRLTAVPRTDPETLETYGVSFHLRARSDAAVTGQRPPEG